MSKPLDISDPAIGQAWKEMSEQKSQNNWMLLKSESGVVTLVGSSSGGYDELRALFDQKSVMYGVLKVIGKDVRKSVESLRPKFIFFTYIGDEVSTLTRAKVSVQRQDVEKLFNGYAVRVDISGNLSGFSREELAKELLKCGGAHAPTHYVFGPNDEYEVPSN